MRRGVVFMVPALALLFVLGSPPATGGSFTATASGAWNSSGTWGEAGVPGAGDLAVIPAGITVTISSGLSAYADSIVVRGSLNFSGNSAELDVAGTVLNSGNIGMGNGGTLRIGRRLMASGGTFSSGTASGSTVDFNGTGAQQIPGYQFYNLTISNGAAVVSTEGNVSVRGKLSVREGAVLSPRPTDKFMPLGLDNMLTGAGTVQVTHTGSITNPTRSNGHFGEQYQLSYDSLAYLTVEYAGTAPQVVTSLAQYYPIAYGGLKISNAAGVMLAGDITVARTLTLSSGSVNTGSYLLSVGSAGTVVRSGGYVAGTLERWVMGGEPAIMFDVGSAGRYAPLAIVFADVTTPGTVRASTTGSAHPSIGSSPLIAAKSLKRYWTISKGGLAYGQCDITLTFQAADIPAGADPSKFTGARYSGGVWSFAGAGTATLTSTQASGVTALGDFTAGEPVPSPPPPPVLSSPDSGSLVSTVTPMLSWKESPAVSSYSIELADNPEFVPVLAKVDGIRGTSASVSPPLTAGSRVFWRVTAVNDGGSARSAEWIFGVTPPPSRDGGSPADGAGEVSTTPNFRWSQAANAAGYRLQVSPSGDFARLVLDHSLMGTSYAVPRTARLASGTTYYWRCSAVYAIGESPFSDAWRFTTLSGPTVLYVNSAWAGHQAHDTVEGHDFGVDAFASIQPAVNAAPEEASVQIAPGTYAENITVRRTMFITGGSGVTVDGGAIGPCTTLMADGISIEGVSFQHGTDGVSAQGSDLVLKGCRMERNLQCGVRLTESDYGILHGNTISDNGTDGISVSGSKHVTIAGNMLSGNNVNVHVSRKQERSSPGTVIQGNTFRAAFEWNVLFEGDPATAGVRFNVFGPEGIDKYICNTAEGRLDARDNWFGGKEPPAETDFRGEIDYTALPAGSIQVALFPAGHAVPLDGRITLPVMGLVPPGRSLKGTSVTLEWNQQTLAYREGIERGYFFGNRAGPEGQEWFTWQPESPVNRITIDQALLGGSAGAGNGADEVPYVGTLFAVRFTARAGGTAQPVLSGVVARDHQNQTVDPLVVRSEGSIIVDATPPAAGPVTIDNASLETDRNGDGKDDYLRDGQGAVVTATVTDEGGLLASDITADLNPLHGGSGHASVYPDAYDDATHRATWSVEGVTCRPPDGAVSIVVTAQDRAGNTARAAGEIVADNTAPAKVTGFTAAPGHGKVKLSWTPDNIDVKGTVVRFARRNGYPTYSGEGVPAYPPTPVSGDGEAGDAAAPGASLTHESAERDVYYYTAFAYDWAGNYSAADAESQDASTNYYLGDLGSGSGIEIPGTGGYDGTVNYMDLWWFSSLYYTDGDWAYATAREADIGPTSASKACSANDRFGIPAPDGRVDFEDLMIFAMNYANTAPKLAAPEGAQRPGKPGTGTPAVVLQGVPGKVRCGEEFDAILYLSNDGRPVKGCSMAIEFDPSVLEGRYVVPGGLFGAADQGLFFRRVREGKIQIDAAIPGAGRAVECSGEAAVVRFLAKVDGGANVRIARARVRDEKNREREFPAASAPEEIPTAFMLRQNHPNPFNGVTNISYDVPVASAVTIDIYNIIGEKIVRLVERGHEPGRYRALWEGIGAHGTQCASGVYFCIMKGGGYSCVRKLLLTR